MNRFIIFLLYLICCPFLFFSQITNKGILQVEPSTIVYFGDEYVNKSSGIHNNDGDLYLNNNFTNNGVTNSISGTTFFKSSTNSVLTISGATNNINLYNIEVDVTGVAKKGLEVVDGFGLIVKNSVTLLSGDLRLIGDAQLVQTHTGTDINTSVLGKLLKDQQGSSSAYAYNYWSSPVNNDGTFIISEILFDGADSSINSFAPQSVLFNSGSPYNGLPSVVDGGENVTTALTINTNWLYKYSTNDSSYASWLKIDQNSALNPCEGFLMKGTNTLDVNQNYVFKGVPNDGEYVFTLKSWEYLLLGNPYPSAIDSGQFITDNLSTFDGTLYFWVDGGGTTHNTSGYLGGYAIRNLTGGVAPSIASELIAGLGDSGSVFPPSQYIAVGQSFFLLAGEDGGDIVFKNSHRIFKTESSGDSNFYKKNILKSNSQKNEDITNSYIRVGYEGPQGFHRQLVLGFLPNSPATLGYDLGYDATVFDARDEDMFFIIDNDLTKKYVIQGVGEYDNLYEFPLGLTIAQEGEHRIMLDAVENFNDLIFIKDNVLNTKHNISESSFNISLPVGEYLDRFEIVFEQVEALSADRNNEEELNVYYNDGNSIIINNKFHIELSRVFIFNVLGQEILRKNQNLLKEEEIRIPFEFDKGIYFIVIETEKGKHTCKIIN